jgi:hypothetical protein
MWKPEVAIGNRVGDLQTLGTGLRLFSNGEVELLTRYAGEFATPYDVSRFPFGEQRLEVRLEVRNLTSNEISLSYGQDDLDFSRVVAGASLGGWILRFVDLKVDAIPGWYGGAHATSTAALEIVRTPGPVVAAIFIPLLASLIIPLLAIWLNPVEDGIFQVDTYEMVNITIGGLFAIIALNFTVNSVYEVLNSGDNPINRLFALNYVTLAVSLSVNILLVRFGVVARLFGRYAQEQLYLFLTWAIPVLVLATAASIILVALA